MRNVSSVSGRFSTRKAGRAVKVLVSGDRKWTDRRLIFDTLDTWHAECGVDVLIEGCANGADRFAEEWAASRGIENRHYPAPWSTFGKSAGPRRNSWMLLDSGPDVVLAFHDDLKNSVGTGDCVKKARREGVMVVHVLHPLDEREVIDSISPAPETAGRHHRLPNRFDGRLS